MPPQVQKGVSNFDANGQPVQTTAIGINYHMRTVDAAAGIGGSPAPTIAMQIAGLDPTSTIFQGVPASGVLHTVAVTAAGAMVVIGEDEENAASTKVFSANTGTSVFTISPSAVPTPVLSIRPLAGQTAIIFLLRDMRMTGSGARILWQLIYNGSLAVSQADITAASIVSNLLTVTCANTFTFGQIVKLSGMAESFLNGQSVTVIGASPTNFTAAFAHANFSNSSDTGIAAVMPTFQSVNTNSGVGFDTTATVINGGEVIDSGYMQFPEDESYQVHFGFTSSLADTLTVAFSLMQGSGPQAVSASMRWTERTNT